MSYKELLDDNDVENLLTRKEFYSLKANPERNFRDPPDAAQDDLGILLNKHLRIHSHQLFDGNLINPDTPYKRLHLLNGPGTGKTLGAIYIAHRFIKIYRRMYANLAAKTQAGKRNYSELDRGTPTVFVLGFGGAKTSFIRDLLKYPEFGFITVAEKEELGKRQKIAESGFPDDIKHMKEYYSQLKKRITNKSKDGFFKFFGYDEFVNRLFISENVKLTDLETLAIQKLKAGENITLEDIIREHIKDGKIQVNMNLLEAFKDSLLICDEIHNTYNMNMKNNRGVAIQFILDSVPSLRFLSLSATPINNSPTEVVELINYLVQPDKKITKKGFFKDARTLHTGKLEEIGQLLMGRISFLQDTNMKYFPKREMIGESLEIPHDVGNYKAGDKIPYLKFIECPMSAFHQSTYLQYVEQITSDHANEPAASEHTIVEKESHVPAAELFDEETSISEIKTIVSDDNAEPSLIEDSVDNSLVANDDDEVFDDEVIIPGSQHTESTSYHTIPTDGYSIYDIAFPNPENNTYGIFRSSEVRNKISAAPQSWKDEHKITIKRFSAINSVIAGDFLLRENIGKYSTKCVEILNLLTNIIAEANSDPNKCQKVMIYHDRVKMSGVLLIQELLRANGYIDETSEAIDSTICCICGKRLREHSAGTNIHDFYPARFVVAHSDIDKITMSQSIEKYVAADNAHGLNYMILIGSKIIKESYDFKDIQNVIITSLPVNIPTLIQVFGRSIRKNSHINLPLDQRRVRIYILISTVNTKVSSTDLISPEMYRYIDKISDYIVIQTIERELNRGAIDADIHRDIIMPPELLKLYFPSGPEGETATPIDSLGNLYFEPARKLPLLELVDINLSTFNAYKYYEDEIAIICSIIKRLFMLQPVWTYDDLWAKVRAPPMGLEVNPGLFLENNFIIALHQLVNSVSAIISAKSHNEHHTLSDAALLEKIFDYNERYIYKNNQQYKIEQVDKYYILFPVSDIPSNPLNVVYAEYLEHVRDKERAMIKSLAEPNDRVIIDVETYLRSRPPKTGMRISVDEFVKTNRDVLNLVSKKKQFMTNYQDRDVFTGFLSEYSAAFQMAILEEAIIYKMMILQNSKTVIDEAVDGNESRDYAHIYEKVLALFDQFKVVIYVKEIRKYKDTIKQFQNGLPNLPDDAPIGYVTAKSVRLFDPTGLEITTEVGKWLEVSKISLNRQIIYKENEIIIGYLESAEDYTKFKLRKPVQKIREGIREGKDKQKKGKETDEEDAAKGIVDDTRLIERGIVCGTKNKHELLTIIASLGISVSKLDKSDIRIKKLCTIIKNRLIESEIRERSKDSRYKYLYGWWDEPVDIATRL